jgi:hypothetical protein
MQVIGTLILLLAIFTYNTPLLLLPFALAVVIFWRGWNKPQRWLVPVLGMCVVMAIGFGSLITLSHQKSGITIFADESSWMNSVEYRAQFSGIAQKILGNKGVFWSLVIGRNLVVSFMPYFLVIHGGGHPWHTLPGFGHLVGVTYGMFVVGMVASIWLFWHQFKHPELAKLKRPRFLTPTITHVMCGWWLLLTTLLPSAITVDAPHATRSLAFFWLCIVFATFGFQTLWRISRRKIFVRLIIVGLVVLLLAQTGRYLQIYFQKYAAQTQDILHGNVEKILAQTEARPDLRHVAFVDEGGFEYIRVAWYLKLPPNQFFNTLQRHQPDRIGFRYGYKLGKYRFIVSHNDRFPEENGLIEWNDQKKDWQLNTSF